MSENTVSEQLKKVAADVLSEETLGEIEQAFNESVASKADELAQLRVEKALIEQDEEHAVKLEKLLEAIDTDHTNKLKRVVESIDKSHAEKLKTVIERFRGEIDQDAKVFKEGLVTNISDYLDLYVEKHIPTHDIQEAVKNRHALSLLENLRKALSVDSAITNEHVREAVIDGKKQLDEASARVSHLKQENETLRENLNIKEASLTLDKLTQDLPANKKRHLHKMFDGKSVEFINENFEYTLQMFEKSEADKVDALKEQATVSKKISDRPVGDSKRVVKESVEQQIEQVEPDNKQDRGLFDNYMGELGRW